MKGHVRKRGNKWCFVIDLGRDETGKRRQKWFSGYRTKKDAEKALAERLTEINKGVYIEPTNMTFRELLQLWLAEYVKPNCRPKTHEDYSRHIRIHIEPALGGVPVYRLAPVHFQKLYNELHANGLSSSFVQIIHTICRSSLKWAVEMQMLQQNSAEKAKPPKKRRSEMRYWTSEQVQHFLNTISDHVHYPLFYLAFFTGMRRGELCALHWEDVDLQNGRISVKRTTQRLKGKGLSIYEHTKTKMGRRVIDISPGVISTLKKHKAKQAAEFMQIGHTPHLVFCTYKGTPVDPNDFRQYFQRLTKKAGLPPIRLHDIRHTHATMLLQQGVHPKIVQERLGHSTIQMTLDTYSHLIPSMQKDAANLLDDLFGQGNAEQQKNMIR